MSRLLEYSSALPASPTCHCPRSNPTGTLSCRVGLSPARGTRALWAGPPVLSCCLARTSSPQGCVPWTPPILLDAPRFPHGEPGKVEDEVAPDVFLVNEGTQLRDK